MPEHNAKAGPQAQSTSQRTHPGEDARTEGSPGAALKRQVLSALQFNALRRAALRQRAEGLSSLRAGPAGEKHSAQSGANATLAYKLHFQLAFSIDGLAPQVLIEGRKARVYFTIMNFTPNTYTDLTVTAVVVPQFFPHGLVEDGNGYPALSSWPIPVLHPFEFRQGVLTFVVPPASIGLPGGPETNILMLSLDQFQQPSQEQLDQANAAGFELFGSTVFLAADALRFDSGARYRLAVTGISIKSIASVFNDTVAIAVAGSAAGVTTPEQSEALGDHGPGTQIPVHLPGVGFFDSVANGNDDRFTMSYAVANAGGGGEEDLKTALDWISRIAAAVVTAVTRAVYAPLWAALDGFTEWLNSKKGRCNRLVAMGVDTFSSAELWVGTLDSHQATEAAALPLPLPFPLPPPLADLSHTAEYVTKRGDGEGAECGTADYVINRTIFRDRSMMAEFIDLGDFDPNTRNYPSVVHLKYGQTLALDELINLSPGNLAGGLGKAHRLWAKEAGEGTINQGTFIAPGGPSPGVGEFAVVTLQMLLNGAEIGHGFVVVRFT